MATDTRHLTKNSDYTKRKIKGCPNCKSNNFAFATTKYVCSNCYSVFQEPITVEVDYKKEFERKFLKDVVIEGVKFSMPKTA